MYKSRFGTLPGSSHGEVIREARFEYHKIQKLSPRRQAHVRSKYFRKDKVFVNQFWRHLEQKHPRDQLRRAKLFLCGIDLIRNTSISPETIISKEQPDMLLHRFRGVTKDGQSFMVQVKEDKRTNRKDFTSVFPTKLK